MSSARFLLEFEATGDQEVVNAIREVGTAGKETAAELEGLQGIEDPFAAVGEGAESAIQPLTEVGTATGELGGIFTEAGGASEEFGGALTGMNTEIEGVSGGLTEANTVVGEFGEATTGAGASATSAMSGIGQMSGAIVGLGGTIGTAISTIFRMQDAQLALDKANLKTTKSTEAARKAEVAFDTLLKSATGNTQGITAARAELSSAQDALNKMQEAGITSGAEYEAAQARVAAATSALRGEFVQGGGDANKFDAAMNKVSITQDAMAIAAKNLEKATRQYGQTQLETGLAVAGFVGTAIQAVSSLKNIKEGAATLSPLLAKVGKAIAGTTGAAKLLAAGIGALAIGFGGFIGVMTAIDQNVGGVKDALKGVHDQANQTIPALTGMFDYLGKTFATNTEGFGAWGAEVQKMLGIPVAEGPKAEAALQGTADASTAVGTATEDMGAKLKGAMDAANGNTTAIAALQRTHADLQMDIDRSGTSLDDFQQIMYTAKQETDGTTSSTDMFANALDAVNAGMARTTDQASELSNVFPEMGANIENALLGQEQNMDIAIKLWNDFNERVKAGQYEIGEFTKYIGDMGYELTEGVQQGVDIIDEMTKKIEEAKGTIPGYIDEVRTAITEGNTEMYNSGQLVIQTLTDEEAAVLALQDETSKATAEYLKNKQAKEDAAEASRNLAASLISEAGSAENAAQAIAESHLEYAKSVDAVADINAVLTDQKAHQEAVAEAVNKTTVSVKQEQIALEAAIAATQDKVIQDQELTNAKLEGTKAAMEFISSLDEEKASQQANISVLHNAVSAMGVFGDATLQSAEQLEQFAAVAAGVPSAIRELAGEIGSLAQEATKFIEFTGEENELFGNWKVSDTIPKEIRAMMSDADIAFIHGRAALERTMESLGPLTGAKFAKAIQTAKQGGLGELRSFGTEAAAMLREGFPTMDSALRELADSFAIMGTAADKDMIPAMQRVITAMQNVEDPAAALTQQMLALQQQSGASAAPLLSVAGGLEQLSAAGADATVKLSEIPLVKITDDAGNAVAEFANFGGQLVPIGPAAQGAASGLGAMTGKINPLNAAIQAAGKSMEQFGNYVGDFFQNTLPSIVTSHAINVNPLAGMITAAMASLDQFASAVAQKMAAVRAAFASGLGGVKQTGGGIPIQVNIAPALKQLQSLKVQIAAVKQAKPVPIALNIAPAVAAANKIRSIVNALPHIKRTITYTYRIVGSRPNPPNLNRTITYRYRTVGSRPAQTGMHETLGEDTMIAAHKGERVDISPNTIYTNEERVALVPGGGGRKGGAEYVIPVTLMLDNKVLVRTVSRGLMEDVGGVS